MPRVDDPIRLRAILNTDRPWNVYALGDLDERRFHDCRWFCSGEALVLLYQGAGIPVLFATGDPRAMGQLIDESGPPPLTYLHLRPDALPLIHARYRSIETETMLRMVLDRPSLTNTAGVVPLGAAHIGEIEHLYADGTDIGEHPDFFFPSMLGDETFFGIRNDRELLAVAGTHLVAPAERVAAIGNVYTRRDHRGKGLAARVTSAVVESLLDRGITTVALSVKEDNIAAIRVYERLGFMPYCRFIEGVAASVIS